jgi:NAD-dependent DNA ligase
VKADPIISDQEYDMEFKRLQRLEKETGFIHEDSPTQTPGSDCEHSYPDWAKEDLNVTVQKAKMKDVDDGR